MNRTLLNAIACGGLTVTLGSSNFLANHFAEANELVGIADNDRGGGKGKGKGGDKPQANEGNRKSGNNAQSGGDGNKNRNNFQPGTDGSNNRNKVQNSGGGGNPNSAGNQGTPRPNIIQEFRASGKAELGNSQRGQPPVVRGQPPISGVQGNPQGNELNRFNSNANIPRVGTSGNIPRGNQGSRIVDQPFVGNSIQLDNRNYKIGPQSYKPSYYRHPDYQGHWHHDQGNDKVGAGHPSGSNSGRGAGSPSSWGFGDAYHYGGRNGVFGNGYGYRPIGWGLGGWGLGSLIYHSGYLGYSNPYYDYARTSGYNYSVPIPVTYSQSLSYPTASSSSPNQILNSAIVAFKQNNYEAALGIVTNGISQFPDDAVMHEFRSLVLFAMRDYQQSAGTIHSVLAVGPGWDWATLSRFYSNIASYTEQLRALEAFTKSNPQDAASHFLLAYHYMSCGHPADAARKLQQVVALIPDDRVANDILKMISAPQPTESLPPPQPQQSTENVDPNSFIGTWKAERGDGSKFELTLTNDAKFTWSFSQNDQAPQQFEGTYSVKQNVLALERRDGGGSLIAEIRPGGETQFNFRLLGAPVDDLGLDFKR